MADIHIPLILVWKTIKGIAKCAAHPQEICATSMNTLYWIKEYYIKKNKTQNFIVNKRTTDHTILQDGTLITFTRYSITMLDNGTFYTEKYYISDNYEEENGKRKVDMSQYQQIYQKLDHNVKENRFKEHLIIASLIDGHYKGSKFVADIINKTEKKLDYYIKYPKLKRFQSFEFFVCITVPREFDRNDAYDSLKIEPIYGIFEFTSKVDKQRHNSHKYLPIIKQAGREIEGIDIDNIFYTGEKWKLFNPKASKLETE